MNERAAVENILRPLNIELNGKRPWDIQVHDDSVYNQWLAQGSLGIGESYMQGKWSSGSLDQTIAKLIPKIDELENKIRRSPSLLAYILRANLLNLQTKIRSKAVIDTHYDLDIDQFAAMLDPLMQYTCAYWNRGATDLASAQEDKVTLIAEKLKLEPGMSVLDFGSGFGGLAYVLASKYGAEVTAVTLSKKQHNYAEKYFSQPGIDFICNDYRNFATGKFDRIIAVGLLEHVGYKNYASFFSHLFDLLKDDGLALVHTIGSAYTTKTTDEWIDRYIFPNGLLPSARNVTSSIEEPYVIEDWHNFGENYDRTLMCWYKNLRNYWLENNGEAALCTPEFKMWEYYLLSCAGNFRSHASAQLWQIVLTKRGHKGGYISVR